jgi:hypothetical protein
MNTKIVIVLFLIAGALYSVLSVTQNTPLVEGWWGNIQLSSRVEPNVKTKCGFQSIPDNNIGTAFSVVPGKYDTVPPPRITGMAQTAAAVKYNMPDKRNMALDPRQPVNVEKYANVVEPFKQFKAARENLIKNDSKCYNNEQLELPSDDMSGMGGEQPAIYNRLIFSNKKSRNYASSDFIRGDLPIVPNSGNWFVSSINNPNTDLNQGAINIIAGPDNETARRTLELKNAVQTGSMKTVEGNIGPGQTGDVMVSTM